MLIDRQLFAISLFGTILSAIVTPVQAGAIRDIPGFTTNAFPANDDESIFVPSVPFSITFAGGTYNSLWLNNNGNITFTGPLRTYTPFALAGETMPIIAAFWADVDTRVGNVVTYGSDMVREYASDTSLRKAFGVDWHDVGYYAFHVDKLNDFQLVLIDRSDTGSGNFDVEFNYNKTQWEAGDVSGGTKGVGGQSSAVVGYATGLSGGTNQLPGSLKAGAFLDGGGNSLIVARFYPLSAPVLPPPGRYIYEVRGGTTPVPGSAPNVSFQPSVIQMLNGSTVASFNNSPSGSFFDPPSSSSSQYTTVGNSLFSQIQVDGVTTRSSTAFATVSYILSYGNTSVALPAGASYTFPGTGVSSFSISGDTGPIALQFNTSTANFNVTVSTPEPGTLLSFGMAALILVLLKKRDHSHHSLTQLFSRVIHAKISAKAF